MRNIIIDQEHPLQQLCPPIPIPLPAASTSTRSMPHDPLRQQPSRGFGTAPLPDNTRHVASSSTAVSSAQTADSPLLLAVARKYDHRPNDVVQTACNDLMGWLAIYKTWHCSYHARDTKQKRVFRPQPGSISPISGYRYILIFSCRISFI